jgi:hypothetical protein
VINKRKDDPMRDAIFDFCQEVNRAVYTVVLAERHQGIGCIGLQSKLGGYCVVQIDEDASRVYIMQMVSSGGFAYPQVWASFDLDSTALSVIYCNAIELLCLLDSERAA